MVQNTTQSIPYKGEGTINIHINNPSAGVTPMPQMTVPMFYPIYYPIYYYPSYYMNNGIDKSLAEQLKNIAAMQLHQQQKINEISDKVGSSNEREKYYQTLAQSAQPMTSQQIQQLGQSGAQISGVPNYLQIQQSIPAAIPQGVQQNNYETKIGAANTIPNSQSAGSVNSVPAGQGLQDNASQQNSQVIAQQNLQRNYIEQPNNRKKEIVILTDNYIKNLENFLRNPNVELRQNAMKEVLDRFKEERSRVKDPALTALLNLGLQDSAGSVKALAMAILDAGYAEGDKTTQKILKNMKNSNNNYSQDALWAANTLLKMSGEKVIVDDNSINIKRKG